MSEEADQSLSVTLPTKRTSWQWLRVLSPLALIALWQIVSASGLISSRTLAAPSQVIVSLWSLVASSEMKSHPLISLGRAAKGLALAIVLGGTLALVAGLSKVGEYIIDAPMQMFRTLPVVALVRWLRSCCFSSSV